MIKAIKYTLALCWPLLGALALTGVGLALLGEPVGEVARLLVEGSWGTANTRCAVLVKTMTLILTGMAVVLPYRAGLFNIGGEGQLFVGGLAAALVGTAGFLPGVPGLHPGACVAAGAVAGAGWALGPALLRTGRGVHEILTTIIFNFLALYIVNHLVQGPFSGGPGLSQTAHVLPSAELPILWQVRAQKLSLGLPLAGLLAVLGTLYLHRMRWGRLSILVGRNPTACRYSGVLVGRQRLVALLLGGAVAGFGGALEVCGLHGTLQARFVPGVGFDGIAVAFLARAEPLACIPAALAIATLRTAGQSLQLELDISKDVVSILEAVTIAAVSIQVAWSKRSWTRNIPASSTANESTGGEKAAGANS